VGAGPAYYHYTMPRQFSFNIVPFFNFVFNSLFKLVFF